MWMLIFIVATANSERAGSAAITQEFSSKEKCMVAQQTLIQQAKERDTFVLNNTCVPK